MVSEIQYREAIKILTPKQMLQTLPIALAQIKAVNALDNTLWNSGNWVYNNIINSTRKNYIYKFKK